MDDSPDPTSLAAPAYRVLRPGDPAPAVRCASSLGEPLSLDILAGRFLVLCVFVTTRDTRGAVMLAAGRACVDRLNRRDVGLVGLGFDAADLAAGRLARIAGRHPVLVDASGESGRSYGALPMGPPTQGPTVARRVWYVIDPDMRIREVVDGASDAALERLRTLLQALPESERFAGEPVPAPVLLLPRVLEPEICQDLITRYERAGGTPSGFMIERQGVTIGRNDPSHKVRSDHTIEDDALRVLLQRRIKAKVAPQIEKVHHFRCSRMERYIVACYDAADGGHFRAHRDNTTRGTAHRRFAVSINLNDDYDGGTIHFPEYGARGYRIGTGGAIVFSCSLLHAVSRVTQGRRFAFLPFLYDDAAALIRERNDAFLHESVGAYRGAATAPSSRDARSPTTDPRNSVDGG
jgi:predicted 2-oxoglutarate/Fe(II)-dependent dioxygenase YbiX/peroxiredoxin